MPDAPASRTFIERYEVVVVDRELHARLFESLRRDSRWGLLAADWHATAFVPRARPPEPGL
jgi:hypothetical protein